MGNCCSTGRPAKADDPNSSENRQSYHMRVLDNKPTDDFKLSPAIATNKSNNEGLSSVEAAAAAAPSRLPDYIEASKTTVQLLITVAKMTPVPLLQEVLEVVLNLIELCEKVTGLQEQIIDLKDRLASLGVIISGHYGDSQDSTLPPAMEKLRNDLENVHEKLQGVENKGKMVVVFFVEPNKELVEKCVKQVTSALEDFHLSNAIDTKKDLHAILRQLELKFGPEIETMGKNVNYIMHTVNIMGEDIKALLKNEQPHTVATSYVSEMPAQLADKFRGRQEMVKSIGDCLCSADLTRSRVAVLATGGMGKTSLAVEVMESKIVKAKFNSGNQFWVSCKGAPSFAIFMQVLMASLRIKTNLGNPLDDIRAELTASNAPRLIVLDNFETPWDTDKQSEVETVLCALEKIPHISILITMRSNLPPSPRKINWHVEKLLPVDRDVSRQIYMDIHQLADGHDGALDKLLDAVGHMPYAITLMATLGMESSWPLDELLGLWKEAGTEILGDDYEMDRSICLSIEGRLMREHPEAQSLLVILSMLPAGATREHLKWWVPHLGPMLPRAISILNRTALISDSAGESSNNPTYFVYPVVQRYMEHHISEQGRDKLQQAAFKFILDHKSSPGDLQFKDDLKALTTEAINLQGILTSAAAQRMAGSCDQSDEDSILLDSLLVFSLYQLWSKPVLDVTQLVVDLARYLDSKIHLAEALDCLGQIYHHLDNDNKAVSAFKEAQELFTWLSNPLWSAQTTYRLMECYLSLNWSALSEQYALEKDVRAEVEALGVTMEPGLRAISLLTIGYFLMFKHKPTEALESLSLAQDAFGPLGHSLEAGQCLYLVGRCYYSLQNYPKAVDIFKLAKDKFEYLGLDTPRMRTWAMEGYCHLKLQQHDEGLIIFQGCLQEARRLGSVLAIAQDLEAIAEVYEQKGDVTVVKLGYESALEQYKILGNTPYGKDGKERCEYNLSVLDNHEKDGGNNTVDNHLPTQMPHLRHFNFS